MAMVKTDKSDWRLDSEERQFLADILEVMMEEEKIEFWSAKVWLIIALAFFYAMKTMTNYERYYSDNRIGGTPQMFIEQAKEKHAVDMAEIEVKKLELEVLRERAVQDLSHRRVDAKSSAVQSRVVPKEDRVLDQERRG